MNKMWTCVALLFVALFVVADGQAMACRMCTEDQCCTGVMVARRCAPYAQEGESCDTDLVYANDKGCPCAKGLRCDRENGKVCAKVDSASSTTSSP